MQALNYFISSLHTLCHKTIEDTMNTIRLYEISRSEYFRSFIESNLLTSSTTHCLFSCSRLEYDACRTELENQSPGSHMIELQKDFEKHKDKYEKLKCDVAIKMKFLDENQIKVMKKQLLLFHNAISAYFSGNNEALVSTMKQFNLKIIKTVDNQTEKLSFLEQSFH